MSEVFVTTEPEPPRGRSTIGPGEVRLDSMERTLRCHDRNPSLDEQWRRVYVIRQTALLLEQFHTDRLRLDVLHVYDADDEQRK